MHFGSICVREFIHLSIFLRKKKDLELIYFQVYYMLLASFTAKKIHEYPMKHIWENDQSNTTHS